MKKGDKASRAMQHIDDGLVLEAMEEKDLSGNMIISKRRKEMNKNSWRKWAAIAAAFVVVFASVIAVGQLNANATNATVALDVNPSIEIEINKKEKIVEVNALNNEAETVIGDMKLEGLELETGMNAIIGSMLKHGYISTEQNSILVSIDSKNKERSEELKQKLLSEIDAMLKNSNIKASVITQDYDEENSEAVQKAEENKISRAKAALISKIVGAGILDVNGVPYSYEALAGLKVNELKLILGTKLENVEGVASSGDASAEKYISAEEIVNFVLTDSGVRQEDTLCFKTELDLDGDYGALVYEVEFCTADKKYEYELNAITGELIEKETEPKEGHKHLHGAEQNGNGDQANDPKDDDETAPENAISREKALEIAYEHAKVAKENVRRPQIEVDKENGISVFEVEFKSAGMEYEYIINSLTGEIIEYESEPID